MTDNEAVEYQGLAAAVGRLAMTLKRTEDALAIVTAERDALMAQVAAVQSAERSPA